jgi:hypothetical protein
LPSFLRVLLCAVVSKRVKPKIEPARALVIIHLVWPQTIGSRWQYPQKYAGL